MASGGIRSDITATDNVTPGEERTLRWAVQDADEVAVTDFTGWTFAWYLLRALKTAEGLTKLAARALVAKTSASGITASVPNVDVALAVENTEALTAGVYGYELWRTDAGNERRIAYGSLVMVS